MTTLKELKELDAKATSAPFAFGKITGHGGISINAGNTQVANVYLNIISSEWEWGDETINRPENEISKANAELYVATRNALPDLIRVIELAEVELRKTRDWIEHIKPSTVNAGYEIPNSVKIGMEQTIRAHDMVLSEIRKMKGE